MHETSDKPLYNAILNEYISILIQDKQTLVMHLEKSRQKSGMIVSLFHFLFSSIDYYIVLMLIFLGIYIWNERAKHGESNRL